MNLQTSPSNHTEPRCPICHSSHPEVVQQGVWDTPARNVLQCLDCGVVFLHPMMAPAEAALFYDSYEEYEQKREPNADEFNRKTEKERESAARQLTLLEGYLRSGDMLCDIGASFGHFLELARPKVSGVVAIEPNPRSRFALAQRGVRTYSWLEELAQDDIRLDAVSLFHTFEHLVEPLTFLATLRNVLNPHARLFIEVPNVRDVLLAVYRLDAFRRFYYQSMHCYYYDAASLTSVLRRAGFSAVAVTHIQRYSVGNHLQWLTAGKPGGNSDFDRTFHDLDSPYRALLCKQEISDTLVGVFELTQGVSQ